MLYSEAPIGVQSPRSFKTYGKSVLCTGMPLLRGTV